MFSRFTSKLALTVLALILGAIGPAEANSNADTLKTALATEHADCPSWLQHTVQRLHSVKRVNLCDLLKGKAALIVNTASHCGFTKQFKGLEALHQRYASAGLVVLGVPSNDFNQEAARSEDIARVCYKNFGVSFTMLAPQRIRGEQAMPLFSYLAAKSKAPNWNFNKYLVAPDAQVTHFGSSLAPDSLALKQSIEGLLELR